MRKRKVKYEINPLLIPLKYRISRKGNVFNLFQKIPNIYTFLGFSQKDKKELLEKINLNKLSKKDGVNIYSAVHNFLLDELKTKKKQFLENKYNEDVILNKKWIELKQSLKSPLYTFQNIYFKFIHDKQIVDHFGEELAEIVEEILRNDFITTNERKYLIEKAEELNVDNKKMNDLLDKYLDYNLAIKKTLYEICKDGMITEVEKKYLLEKTKEYGISKKRIISETEVIVDKIKRIHALFQNEDVYNTVLLLFLIRFLKPIDYEVNISVLNKMNTWVDGSTEKIHFKKHKNIKKHIILLINKISKIEIFNSELTDKISIDDILHNLGLISISHDKIIDNYCQNIYGTLPLADLKSYLDNIVEKEKRIINRDNYFKVGSEEYEINLIDNSNYPLFSFDTIGNRTIISLNKAHYFYENNFQFKIEILSIVINLKKNYASEDLIDDIQHVFNPPALIKINYPKGI